MLYERLPAAASTDPADVVSRERVQHAAGLGRRGAHAAPVVLDHARPAFGGADELAWLRLGAPFAAGRFLEPEDLDALALSDRAAVTARSPPVSLRNRARRSSSGW